MRNDLLRSTSITVALLCSLGLAAAQTPAPPKDPEQQSQADKALASPSGKMGKEEPSSHAPTVKPLDHNAVLVNGALAVPGAPANSDTVPAKFSEKNAADDKLITIAYTFKNLTEEQRNAIFRALKDQPARSAIAADVGTTLPFAIELHATPDTIVAQLPQTRGYQYVVADNGVLLVAPANRIVVAVIPEAQDVTTGAGRGTP